MCICLTLPYPMPLQSHCKQGTSTGQIYNGLPSVNTTNPTLVTSLLAGFEDSRTLARKMVKLYKLASEQLSQQDHYDFGMRAVKSVLVMAGSLRRSQPNLAEDVVLIRAMRDTNLPKFLPDDIELFQNIISDLFPGVAVPYQVSASQACFHTSTRLHRLSVQLCSLHCDACLHSVSSMLQWLSCPVMKAACLLGSPGELANSSECTLADFDNLDCTSYLIVGCAPSVSLYTTPDQQFLYAIVINN